MSIGVRESGRSPVVELPDVVFPVQIGTPVGFDPGRIETWPPLEGRLEYVTGRLLYMPPTGGDQARTVSDVVMALASWAATHPEFAVCSNEAGMKLGDDVRAADVAVWRASELPGGNELARTPPLLAVEVAGRDDGESSLREKARWYLERGVRAVWIVLPALREVVVATASGEVRAGGGVLPSIDELPELSVRVKELVRQVSRRSSGQ